MVLGDLDQAAPFEHCSVGGLTDGFSEGFPESRWQHQGGEGSIDECWHVFQSRTVCQDIVRRDVTRQSRTLSAIQDRAFDGTDQTRRSRLECFGGKIKGIPMSSSLSPLQAEKMQVEDSQYRKWAGLAPRWQRK